MVVALVVIGEAVVGMLEIDDGRLDELESDSSTGVTVLETEARVVGAVAGEEHEVTGAWVEGALVDDHVVEAEGDDGAGVVAERFAWVSRETSVELTSSTAIALRDGSAWLTYRRVVTGLSVVAIWTWLVIAFQMPNCRSCENTAAGAKMPR